MGTCCSKKKGSSASSSSTSNPVAVAGSVPVTSKTQVNPNGACDKLRALKSANVEYQLKTNTKKEKQEEQESGDGQVKKESFIVNQRKSQDERERNWKTPSGNVSFTNESAESVDNKNKIEAAAVSVPSAAAAAAMGVSGVRTSSCTKEEVDAILIQCGRLSRSSSGKAATPSRKYSGSKRSYDFDHCDNDKTVSTESNSDLCEDDGKRQQYRQRHRQSPGSSQGRRRTPSRERDQNQRSTSRERRISRSPGRRSSEPNTIANGGNSNTGAISARPGKMVSVPATVSSIVMDKSNNGVGAGGESATGAKRISVKRNVGVDTGMVGSRTAASPRSKSPARANANAKFVNENQQQQQLSLSRSSSRKAEQSPYRRNPLGEIDINSLAYPQAANNGSKVQTKTQKEFEGEANLKQGMEMNGNIRNNRRGAMEKVVKEQLDEKANGQPTMADNMTAKTVVASGVESQRQPTITRSRSSRRSRDLDFNHEAVMDAGNSYTALLLEDIQDFHQKNTSASVPACVTKACSIVEAVADLNSTTRSNISHAFSDDRRIPPTTPMQQFDGNDCNLSLGVSHVGKRVIDPFVESKVAGNDDIIEPSFHKYVTVRRGGADMEDQESSGSNSFVASGQQHQRGVSSSSWEPNSADSTDCWSSRLMTKEQDQKTRISLDVEEARRKLNGRRECDHEHSGGIGRGRIGTTNRGLQAIPYVIPVGFHTDTDA